MLNPDYVTPSPTTRPLFHIAQAHGADYTDVLEVSWGIKLELTGRVWNQDAFFPALERIAAIDRAEVGEEHPLYEAIRDHTTEFVHQQGW